MAASRSALDILAKPDEFDLGDPTLVVLVGDEPFLSFHMLALLRERLCPDEADRAWAWREFNGTDDLDPRDVFDEAATVPLFAGATRAAIVRNADAFVTRARAALEAVANGPRGRRGLVILEVTSLPANTRLAKAVGQHGLAVDVTIPGRADLAAWVKRWARSRHGLTLAAATAERLLERLAGNLGQVDQALARLAAATPPA
ncbi:MAG: DNA polymerase III subunit delta, partial [Planctomycetia bacterium]